MKISELSLIKLLETNFLKLSNRTNHKYDLSDLTIIIPTYNRPYYLIRQIIYMSSSSVNLIVVDGSEKKIHQEVIDQLKTFKSFQYIHAADLSYVDRIKYASKKVQSNYAMCLAEDDFLIFSGLKKALNILNNDETLSACFGQIAAIDYNRSKNKSYLIEYGLSLQNYSIRQKNPTERLFFAFNSYRSFSPYAIFKQNHFKEIWSRIGSSLCLELSEYEHAINTLLVGQIIVIDELFWIRSQEVEPIDNKISGSRKNTFKNWYKDKVFEDDVKNFKDRTKNNLMYYLNCSNEDALKLVDELIKKILNNDNHTGLVNRSYFKSIVSSLIKFIKSFSITSNFNKNLKNTFLGKKLRLFIKNFGNKTVNNNFYKKNADEIEKILQITDTFHNN